MVTPHQESWVRWREQIFERTLHDIGPVFPLAFGLAVLLLGGPDRAKLLERIERHLSLIKPGGCF